MLYEVITDQWAVGIVWRDFQVPRNGLRNGNTGVCKPVSAAFAGHFHTYRITSYNVCYTKLLREERFKRSVDKFVVDDSKFSLIYFSLEGVSDVNDKYGYA